jgi:predicted Rossmann fold flavoprotein
MNNPRVIVVGGGASGMMAAYRAAEINCDVIILEKMPRLGCKLRITGKGRCNLTNVEDITSFINHYGDNGRFLYNCFSRFFNDDLMGFFKEHGIALSVERGKRVFSESGEALQVVNCFHTLLSEMGVDIRTGHPVAHLVIRDGQCIGVDTGDKRIYGEAVIVATGGMSYPQTGSTGDGYRMALDLGHRVRKPEPGLVPVEIEEPFVKQMQGVTLKNVKLSAFANGKKFAALFGEMVFTHFGISGPIVLTMSRDIVKRLGKSNISLVLNFKPALTKEKLEQRLLREFDEHGRMRYRNVLKYLLPTKVIDVFVALSRVPGDTRGCEIDRAGRHDILELLTNFRMTVKGVRPIEEAIVTEGGIALDEIDPRTLQSRLTPGLFFCGEVIDVAGDTGGYNLQAAFSTGYVAGESACSMCRKDE